MASYTSLLTYEASLEVWLIMPLLVFPDRWPSLTGAADPVESASLTYHTLVRPREFPLVCRRKQHDDFRRRVRDPMQLDSMASAKVMPAQCPARSSFRANTPIAA